MDVIDKKILALLSEDGRKTASNISDDVGLSVPATSDRIKKLIDNGIIKGFKPIIDSKLINLDITAFITVFSESSKNFEKVVLNARSNINIMKCYTTTGDGSHLLLVKVQNTEKLEKLLRTIQEWPGVSRTQTQIVLSSYNNSESSTTIKPEEK
ncbi:MAG: AsnC family transcriptional regulator [Candidatus Marinimicrobia bacterium]|nr:AsnC family transcriptional regulator [Candidatus Neomarinimicrobiota bacterium]|tara:strand:- start:3078 stop:3539 length:462 start_codon:yes stop_codon:yes gene_type:complete